MELVFGAGRLDRRVADVEVLLREWRVQEAEWGQLYLEYEPVTPRDRVLVEDLAVTMLINSRVAARAATAVCLNGGSVDLAALPDKPLEATTEPARAGVQRRLTRVGSHRQREIEDGLYAKWQEWIEKVYDETITLFLFRSFYRGIVEMTRANDQIPASSFFDAQGAWYATTQVIAVRRQTDMDKKAVSLARLLTNMMENPTVMTRERFTAMFLDDTDDEIRREISIHHANEQFDRYADAGNDTIAPERYEEDLNRFLKTAQPIKDYVDRLVAHNDQRELTSLPTYEDLNAAIDLLAELLNKYMVLLKATGVPDADPVHQAEWRAAFRVAWLQD